MFRAAGCPVLGPLVDVGDFPFAPNLWDEVLGSASRFQRFNMEKLDYTIYFVKGFEKIL